MGSGTHGSPRQQNLIGSVPALRQVQSGGGAPLRIEAGETVTARQVRPEGIWKREHL